MSHHALKIFAPEPQEEASVAALCSELCLAVLQGVRDAAAASTSVPGRRDLQALGQMLTQRAEALAQAFASALVQESIEAPAPARHAATGFNAMALELVDDRQVEQGIEVMRAVQHIHDAAEWEMREHRSLLASLQPSEQGLAEAFSPSACARALLGAFERLGLDPSDRLRLLRAASAALAAWFREHHAQQVRRLRERGVVPAPFRVIVAGAAAAMPLAQGQPPQRHEPARSAAPVGLGLLLQSLQTRSIVDAASTEDNLQQASRDVLAAKLRRLLRAAVPDEAPADTAQAVPLDEPPRVPLLHTAVASRSELLESFQQSVQRRQFEAVLRRQIRVQLHGADIQPSLRRFLLAPWVHALAETLLQHGPDSPLTHRVFECCDDLIELVALRAGSAAVNREALLDTVEEALHLTLLPPGRVRALRDLLGDLLPSPGPAHGSLAEEAAAVSEGRDESGWIETLVPGQWLRLQVDSQWITAELLWCSTHQQFFLFGSQHAGRRHSISRRALLQMKANGRVDSIVPDTRSP